MFLRHGLFATAANCIPRGYEREVNCRNIAITLIEAKAGASGIVGDSVSYLCFPRTSVPAVVPSDSYWELGVRLCRLT